MRFLQFFKLPFSGYSTQSIWIYFTVISWTVPLGVYNWFGPRLFSDWRIAVVSTTLAYAVCALLLLVQQNLLGIIMKRFPEIRQTLTRILLELLLFTGTIGLTTSSLFLAFRTIPFFEFSAIYYMPSTNFWLAACSILLFIGFYECYYTITKWNENSIQAEVYKREVLLNQLDVLKNQINPHFLFNSLNALSSLISEEPRLAEKYVDEMARVYRYLLQTNENNLTTLEKEVDFIKSYYHLLKMRYQAGVSLDIAVSEHDYPRQLPPLTLQLLVENAVKHNRVQANKPLHIQIGMTPDGWLQVRNNLQAKNIRVLSNKVGLSNINAKYRLLGEPEPIVSDQGGFFTVTLPLLNPVSA
ncbi:sensor histidine kinase [Larkinella rosea]|uniref:Histidine kinase n=1 Tax=Larkinella rosea TaxID=2025312 RepID=A0A3P1C0W3_9BACT|nr:sensor histidine kinase [Larkinella rosea]RRB06902.1 histidine kinase [Larkinella rosea]